MIISSNRIYFDPFAFICFFALLSTPFLEGHQPEKGDLLKDALGTVAISKESVEAIYVQAIEKYILEHEYVEMGLPWHSNESGDIASFFAGLNVIKEPTMQFSLEKSLKFNTEIAFEPMSKKEKINIKEKVKLSDTDISSINEALIFGEIKFKSIDPQEFNVNDDL